VVPNTDPTRQAPVRGSPTTDRDLVAAAVGGDRAAFAVLVERHQGRIISLLERLTGCREQARDLAQETFVSAYRKLSSFAHRSEFSTWLYRIACNHAAAFLRKRRRPALVDAALPGGGLHGVLEPATTAAPVSAGLEHAELSARLAAALERLDDRYREVVVLADMHDATYEEVAEVLDIPLGTVRSRLHRGRLELRRLLADWIRNEDRDERRD
jgi:RNA polymerase sigma-70 factor (ECF subfamily)